MDGAAKPSAQTLPPGVWKIAIVAMFGSLLAQLDATIVNVSLSSLAVDLHAPLTTIQWVISGYLLALTFSLPLTGWLVDRIGAKALYLWSFGLFTLSSALCGAAWSATALIGFRLLQGAAGGLIAPMTQMMIKRAAGPQFTRIAGYTAIPVLLGPLLGPMIAGLILHYATWRWLFLVNVPVGGLAWCLAAAFLPHDGDQRRPKKLDWAGLLLLSPGLALVLFGIERLRAPAGLAAAALGAAALFAFVPLEKRRGERALIDLRLFRSDVFRTASVTQFLWNGVTFAGQMLVPLFLAQVWHRSPAAMGLLLAPLGLGMMATVPSLGFLTGRFGERRVAVAGATLAWASTVALAWLAARGPDDALLAVVLAVRGIGMGATGLPTVAMAYASLDNRQLPMATTALNIVQRMGGPVLTTACAIFLAMALAGQLGFPGRLGWIGAFTLLSVLQAAVWAMTMHLSKAVARAG